MKTDLPEEFFNITFLPPENCGEKDFLGERYRVIGEDDVGNCIGEAGDGTIYLLDTDREKGRKLVYFAKDRKTLAAAIRTYRWNRGKAMLAAAMDALFHRNEDNEEELAREEAAELRKKLSALDPAMFQDDDTFWSPLLGEIEWGMI